MKAILLNKYGSYENFTLGEIDTPKIKKGQVLIKVHSSAVNDYDWCMMLGSPFLYRLMFGLFNPKQPICGMELSGTIVKTCEGVTDFLEGDEVYGDISEYGFGCFAQFIAVDARAVRRKPKNMSFEHAASLPHASMLAYQGLFKLTQLKDGQKILINGAGGGVGTIALNLAKQFDIHVTGVDTGEKLKNMKQIGFDEVLDYKKADFTKLDNQYDIIFDTKTKRSPFAFLSVLKKEGHYITVGGNLTRLLQTLLFKPIISLFSSKKVSILALKANKELEYIEALYDKGIIKPVIDGPYPLESTAQMIQRFGLGKHTGKIIINIEQK